MNQILGTRLSFYCGRFFVSISRVIFVSVLVVLEPDTHIHGLRFHAAFFIPDIILYLCKMPLFSINIDKVIINAAELCREEKADGYFSSLQIKDGKQLVFSIKGKLKIMALSLTNSQQAAGVLTFKDKKLAITDVPDGAVTVASSDENVFTVSYEDSTNTVTVVAGNAGVAALTITATNKANETIPFEDIAIEVTTGDAATGGVEFAAPTEQP